MELPHYNCPITVTSSEAPSRSRIRQMWNIRGATAVDVCQDQTLARTSGTKSTHTACQRKIFMNILNPTVIIFS